MNGEADSKHQDGASEYDSGCEADGNNEACVVNTLDEAPFEEVLNSIGLKLADVKSSPGEVEPLRQLLLILRSCGELLAEKYFVNSCERSVVDESGAAEAEPAIVPSNRKRRTANSATRSEECQTWLRGRAGTMRVRTLIGLLTRCVETLGCLTGSLKGQDFVEEIIAAEKLNSPHVGCFKSKEIRLIGLRVIGAIGFICMTVYHSVRWTAVQLDREAQVSMVPGGKKRKKENRQKFESQREHLLLSELLPSEDESKVTIGESSSPLGTKYSRQCHRIAKILDHTASRLFHIAICHMVVFVDDIESEIRAEALISLSECVWKISEKCCPEGAGRLDFALSSFEPLKTCQVLVKGFLKFNPPEPLGDGASNDPFMTSHNSFIPPAKTGIKFSATDNFSSARLKAILNKFLSDTALSGILSKLAAFLCAVESNPNGSLFERIQNLVTRLNKDVLSIDCNPGWLLRSLEDYSADVRLNAARFLRDCFKYDRNSLEPTVKFNLPIQNLLWDSSPSVQREICEGLCVLSSQLPFKDGAFKRFASLLLSPKSLTRSLGIRLLSCCEGINAQAISQALKGLWQQFPSNNEILPRMLKERIRAAARIVETNSERQDELLKCAKDLYTKNANILMEERSRLIFGSFALKLLGLIAEAYVKYIPIEILDMYGFMRREFGDIIDYNIGVFPPSSDPTCLFYLSIPKDIYKAYICREIGIELQKDCRWTKSFDSKIEIISALNAAITDGMNETPNPIILLPIESDINKYSVLIFQDNNIVVNNIVKKIQEDDCPWHIKISGGVALEGKINIRRLDNSTWNCSALLPSNTTKCIIGIINNYDKEMSDVEITHSDVEISHGLNNVLSISEESLSKPYSFTTAVLYLHRNFQRMLEGVSRSGGIQSFLQINLQLKLT